MTALAPDATDTAALRQVHVLTAMRDGGKSSPSLRAWADTFLDWYARGTAAGRAPGSALAWAREQMRVYPELLHPPTAPEIR